MCCIIDNCLWLHHAAKTAGLSQYSHPGYQLYVIESSSFVYMFIASPNFVIGWFQVSPRLPTAVLVLVSSYHTVNIDDLYRLAIPYSGKLWPSFFFF